jgi:hypothetical protein
MLHRRPRHTVEQLRVVVQALRAAQSEIKAQLRRDRGKEP